METVQPAAPIHLLGADELLVARACTGNDDRGLRLSQNFGNRVVAAHTNHHIGGANVAHQVIGEFD